MKSKVLIVLVSLALLGACTQKTCPTYAENDSLKEKAVKVDEDRAM